jgi:hypothetical protein
MGDVRPEEVDEILRSAFDPTHVPTADELASRETRTPDEWAVGLNLLDLGVDLEEHEQRLRIAGLALAAAGGWDGESWEGAIGRLPEHLQPDARKMTERIEEQMVSPRGIHLGHALRWLAADGDDPDYGFDIGEALDRATRPIRERAIQHLRLAGAEELLPERWR